MGWVTLCENASSLEEVGKIITKDLMEQGRKMKIEEFKNQLQQKGIQGEPLDKAVVDFVKFLEKQDEELGADASLKTSVADFIKFVEKHEKESGVNAPCSEPAVPQNNVGDKERNEYDVLVEN